MAEPTLSRRAVVSAAGIAGITLLAGCSSGDGDASGPTYLDEEPAYDGWFEDVDSYEGTLDLTDQDAVTVTVGAGERGLLFDPPAVGVSPGTTVTWEWTGQGGDHNVVSEGDGPLDSDLAGDEGNTYEHTFEESGTYRYKCVPHETLGMKGAVYVP
jgi:halocyanin-like protein